MQPPAHPNGEGEISFRIVLYAEAEACLEDVTATRDVGTKASDGCGCGGIDRSLARSLALYGVEKGQEPLLSSSLYQIFCYPLLTVRPTPLSLHPSPQPPPLRPSGISQFPGVQPQGFAQGNMAMAMGGMPSMYPSYGTDMSIAVSAALLG